MVLIHVDVRPEKNVETNGNNVEENIIMVVLVVNQVLHVKDKMNGIHNV